MTKQDLLYNVNGSIVSQNDAVVSVDDRGFRYGDGVFETIRVYGGAIFEVDAHYQRLQESAKQIHLESIVSKSEFIDRIHQTVEANDLTDAYVRVSVTRGSQPGTLRPLQSVEPTCVVYIKPLPRGGVAGSPTWDSAATLQTATKRKIPDESIPASLKSHNYLSGILARAEHRQSDEVLLCDLDGNIAEGTVSNVFYVKDETIYTPSRDCPILPGITRSIVMELAAEADIPIETGQYRLPSLRNADEVFLTNSIWEIRPVSRFEAIEFTAGKITDTLYELYQERVESLCYES